MTFNAVPEFSKPEYDVLRVLWKHKQLSAPCVREIHLCIIGACRNLLEKTIAKNSRYLGAIFLPQP